MSDKPKEGDPAEPESPPFPPDPPHGPEVGPQVTHRALTEAEEAELPIEQSQKAEHAKLEQHQSMQAQASGPKETRSGSDELASKADTGTSATHGRNRVSDNKA